MIKSNDELNKKKQNIKTTKLWVEKMKMQRIKKIIFCLKKYKMIKISAEAFAKNSVHNIIDKERNCGKELKT